MLHHPPSSLITVTVLASPGNPTWFPTLPSDAWHTCSDYLVDPTLLFQPPSQSFLLLNAVTLSILNSIVLDVTATRASPDNDSNGSVEDKGNVETSDHEAVMELAHVEDHQSFLHLLEESIMQSLLGHEFDSFLVNDNGSCAMWDVKDCEGSSTLPRIEIALEEEEDEYREEEKGGGGIGAEEELRN
ncbi:hypothetical protein PIB30_054208 [Stylosanthes scabra]|uniref:Uncharacterized protein n=1 Tax=Stylosanthes scabra TaxID=79078 RepID=A0ABU6SIL8_9FABA|nr:hypothetical protein [Stylosanthes scabra]